MSYIYQYNPIYPVSSGDEDYSGDHLSRHITGRAPPALQDDDTDQSLSNYGHDYDYYYYDYSYMTYYIVYI